MPLDLELIRASEFIRLGAHGYFDLKASKVALAEIARACHKRGIGRAMLDLRDLHLGPKPVFTPADLAELVNCFHEIGFTSKQRLAVLYSSDPHGRARMFSMISIIHGWHVRGFGSFEDALIWLSQEEVEQVGPSPPTLQIRPDVEGQAFATRKGANLEEMLATFAMAFVGVRTGCRSNGHVLVAS